MNYNTVKLTTKLVPSSDAWTLQLVGDVDAKGAWVIRLDEVSNRLEKAKVKTLVIDLSEAEIIDSSGLSLLLEARRDLYKKDIEVILLNPSTHVQRLFKILQFDRVFTVRHVLCV